MLPPNTLDGYPDRLVALYAEVEADIIADMARRIAAFDDLIPAAEWQFRKLLEMGEVHDEIMRRLSRTLRKSRPELERIMREAADKALSVDDAIYRKAGLAPTPLPQSPALRQVMDTGMEQTAGLFDNLTRTTADTATRQFEHALDRAWLQVQSGAFDHVSATRSAIKMLTEKGLAAITYPTGHTDYLDVAVRRAVLTGVNQTALKLQDTRAQEMDSDLVEASAHAGARHYGEGPANHAEWQGKIYSRSGTHPKYPSLVAVTGYGTGEGLGGWNCRHNMYPYIEGVSEPMYTQAELDAMSAKTYEYGGVKMTEYEARQLQRSNERQIRRWKREYKASEAAGLPTEQAASKLSYWQKQQKDYLEHTGLKRQHDREKVEGFGRGEAAKASAQARRPALTNAAGQPILRVKSSEVKLQGEPNTITQTTSKKGGVSRNYYDGGGRQIKQVSNTHHGHKAVMAYGKSGEHAHDYQYDADGKLTGRPYRELNERERKENSDIL